MTGSGSRRFTGELTGVTRMLFVLLGAIGFVAAAGVAWLVATSFYGGAMDTGAAVAVPSSPEQTRHLEGCWIDGLRYVEIRRDPRLPVPTSPGIAGRQARG